MDKRDNPSLFINDGSFMERFRQLQQEQQEKAVAPMESKPCVSGSSSVVLKPGFVGRKRPLDTRPNDAEKPNNSTSNGKLAFSLKQKSRVVRPGVKLGEDEDEEREDAEPRASDDSAKRKKLAPSDVSKPPKEQGDAAYILIIHPWWKEMLIERIGKRGMPATTVFAFPCSCSWY